MIAGLTLSVSGSASAEGFSVEGLGSPHPPTTFSALQPCMSSSDGRCSGSRSRVGLADPSKASILGASVAAVGAAEVGAPHGSSDTGAGADGGDLGISMIGALELDTFAGVPHAALPPQGSSIAPSVYDRG